MNTAEQNQLPSVAVQSDQSTTVTLDRTNANPALNFEWKASESILQSRIVISGFCDGADAEFIKVVIYKGDEQIYTFKPGRNGPSFGVTAAVQQDSLITVKLIPKSSAPQTVVVNFRLFIGTAGRKRQYQLGDKYSYNMAEAFCGLSSQQMCNRVQYCPADGEPAFEAAKQLWSPVADEQNDWVQMGAHRQCTSFVQHYGEKPDWGKQTVASEKKGDVLCCSGRATTQVQSPVH